MSFEMVFKLVGLFILCSAVELTRGQYATLSPCTGIDSPCISGWSYNGQMVSDGSTCLAYGSGYWCATTLDPTSAYTDSNTWTWCTCSSSGSSIPSASPCSSTPACISQWSYKGTTVSDSSTCLQYGNSYWCALTDTTPNEYDTNANTWTFCDCSTTTTTTTATTTTITTTTVGRITFCQLYEQIVQDQSTCHYLTAGGTCPEFQNWFEEEATLFNNYSTSFVSACQAACIPL